MNLFEHNRSAYEAVAAVLAETGKAAVVHPTGTGKSFIGFKLCEDHPDQTVCWLSPSDYIFRTQLENLSDASPDTVLDNVNIGGGTPENLLDYISTLQEELVNAGVLPADYDFEGHRELVGMQPGDVPVTYADSKALEDDYGFRPTIGIREGLRKFAQWYAEYYK